MIVDKTKTATKILAFVCAISAILGVAFCIRGFVLYKAIIAVADAVIAFVCFKGIGKDRELFLGTLGVLTVYDIVLMFASKELELVTAILTLLRVAGYILLALYFLAIIKNKIVPIIGGAIVCVLFAYNVYGIISAYINLQNVLGSNAHGVPLGVGLNLFSVMIYMVPALAMTLLIAFDCIRFMRKE